MNFNANDSRFMARALQLAQRGYYTTRTNPRVGCVLVKDHSIIGDGWHQQPGLAHAEINAIADAQKRGYSTEGATAYVTLEPCSHFGKTPPCAQSLIDAGVLKVVCAMPDPNPQVSGRGIKLLQDAGVVVLSGLMEKDAQSLNLGFIKRMREGLPRVVAKMAVSADGRTAMASGESQWITGPNARQEVQRLRASSGAIITGSGTVNYDDPSMNVRQQQYLDDPYFTQPLRVVIDSKGQISPQAKIFKQQGDCWLITKDSDSNLPTNLPNNVRIQTIKTDNDGYVDLIELLKRLASEGINDVLLEAGSELLGAFLQQKLVDELIIFMAPKLLGSMAKPMAALPFDTMEQAIHLELKDLRQIGQDLKLTYRVD